MHSTRTLCPGTPEDLAETLAFALRYEGRKRLHHADITMARITADRLARPSFGSGAEATLTIDDAMMVNAGA
jgi:hypothetical protein